MAGFFKKLNTLVSSQINDVLRPLSTEDGDAPRKRVARDQVRQGLSRDIEGLRKRITDAQEYEQTLQRRLDRLYGDVERWDTAADQAVADGRQVDARMALERLQAAQRDLARTEDDLRQHQEITAELVSKVNYMDYVVNQPDDEQQATPAPRRTAPVSPAEPQTASPDEAVATSPKVHILGQAPTVMPDEETLVADAAPVQKKKPSTAPAKKQPEEPRRISVQVEIEADSPNEPEAAIPVQTTVTPTQAPAATVTPEEQQIRQRRSRYAQVGDAEYAEGVELAKDITQKLDTTREKLAQLVQENTPTTPERDVLNEVKQEVDQGAVEDELSRRISRLSKPSKPSASDDVPPAN